MHTSKKISIAVVKRLPRYYRYLSDLLKLDITRISSKELSEKMGVTASQIRQDLNCFGGFGQQGYGYNVESLYKEIGLILGLDNDYKAIIIGAGNMGQALANYKNFTARGYEILGIFDVSPQLIGKKINNIEVMNMDYLDKYLVKNKVDIAILCVPFEFTAEIADKVANLGIKGLWNFSPMDLELPYDVTVENVHLSDSLMVLGYRMNERQKEREYEARVKARKEAKKLSN
jgi:redox-sensing transcriptional repressor